MEVWIVAIVVLVLVAAMGAIVTLKQIKDHKAAQREGKTGPDVESRKS